MNIVQICRIAINTEANGTNKHLHMVVRRTIGSHYAHQLMVTYSRVDRTPTSGSYRHPPLAAHAVHGCLSFAHRDSFGLPLSALLTSGHSFDGAEPTQFRGSPRRAVTVNRTAKPHHRYSQQHIYRHNH